MSNGDARLPPISPRLSHVAHADSAPSPAASVAASTAEAASQGQTGTTTTTPQHHRRRCSSSSSNNKSRASITNVDIHQQPQADEQQRQAQIARRRGRRKRNSTQTTFDTDDDDEDGDAADRADDHRREFPRNANELEQDNDNEGGEFEEDADEVEDVDLISSGDELDDGSVCSCCCSQVDGVNYRLSAAGAGADQASLSDTATLISHNNNNNNNSNHQLPPSGQTSKRGSRASCSLEAHRNSTASSSAAVAAATSCCVRQQQHQATSTVVATDDANETISTTTTTRTTTTTTLELRSSAAKTDCDVAKANSLAGADETQVGRDDHDDEKRRDGEHQVSEDDAVVQRNEADESISLESKKSDEHANKKLEAPPQSEAKTTSDQERQDREAALTKRRYVLTELVETERDYVSDLGKIVEGYLEEIRRQLVDCGVDDILTTGVIPSQQQQQQQSDSSSSSANTSQAQESNETGGTVATSSAAPAAAAPANSPKLPDALKDGKHKIIFGNIEAIYEFHRDHFLQELERCLDEATRLGPLFKRYERRLNMYVVYCQNKPRSEAIVSEHLDTFFEELRIKLGHKLQLPDLLIKPVQRIMKYQLLLKDILRYTERANLIKERDDLKKAVEIMLVVPKAADDMMNVGRLNGFPGKLTAQGKLIKQGILLFCDLTPLLTNLSPSLLAELMSQIEKSQPDQFNSHMGGGGGGNNPAADEYNATTGGGQSISLSTNMIGSSQMNNCARLLLNQLLANSNNQVKLRERQTFLFEQTIIFSEVLRKDHKSSSSSGSAALGGGAGPASNSSSNTFYHQSLRHQSGGGGGFGSSTPSSVHPSCPHSHGPQGGIELCCPQNDCTLPQTGSPCDRLPTVNPAAAAAHHHPDQSDTSPNNSQQQQQPLHHHHSYFGQWSPTPHYYSAPSYQYKNHLSINKVALIDKHYGPSFDWDQLSELFGEALNLDAESRRFMLKSRDPNQDNVIYLLQTGCALDRDDWVCSIRSMLECQLDFLRALQSPIAYQRGLTKDGSTPPEFNSLWNPELRKTLSNPSSANKFHRRIPSLFSQSTVERGPAGSVKVTSKRSAGAASTSSATNSSAGHQLSHQSTTTSSFSGGNAKYLRYVRSKLSKSRLNSVLSLTGGGGGGKEQQSAQPSLDQPAEGQLQQQQQQETICSEQASIEQQLATSGGIGPDGSALATRELVVSSLAQSQMTTVERVAASSRLEVHRPIGFSLSSEPAPTSGSLIDDQHHHQQQQSGTDSARQQASKKSTFFQGFRYTLRGRRGSKQTASARQQQQQAIVVQQQNNLASSESSFAAQNQLQQSHSLSSISGTSTLATAAHTVSSSSASSSTTTTAISDHQQHQLAHSATVSSASSLQRFTSAMGTRHKLLHSDATQSSFAVSTPVTPTPDEMFSTPPIGRHTAAATMRFVSAQQLLDNLDDDENGGQLGFYSASQLDGPIEDENGNKLAELNSKSGNNNGEQRYLAAKKVASSFATYQAQTAGAASASSSSSLSTSFVSVLHRKSSRK